MGTREIVQRRPVLAPQPEQILKARGRDQHDTGPTALEQGIRRHRRAVHEHIDGVAAELVERPEQTERGVLRCARHLPDFECAVGCDRDEIGERPADVDADTPHGRKRRLSRNPAPPRVSTTTSTPTQSPSRT